MAIDVDPEGMLKVLMNDRHGDRDAAMGLELADTLVVWLAGGGWMPKLDRLDERQQRTLVYYSLQTVIDDCRRSLGERVDDY